jgi:citrate lyase subunit alpha/citrate CoA-transferase
MKNSLNREIPSQFKPFTTSDINFAEYKVIPEKPLSGKVEFINTISEIFDILNIKDGMTLSFHHHLRNGDYVMNMVLEEVAKRNLRNLTIAASSIFPIHEKLCKLIENRNVIQVYTNYISGPVADTIIQGKMQELFIMNTHGSRDSMIESGKLKIDVAFIATPCVDKEGNGNGTDGISACGALGYAQSDLKYANKVVLVTDTIVDKLGYVELDHKYVDYIVKVDRIGDQKGIVSGTTKITSDPVGLRIAYNTARLINELGLIKNGFSMQTGAGGTSLAVSKYVKDIMIKNNIKGSFACGGITAYFVNMLNEGLFDNIYDVQCFDLDAVESYKNNPKHIGISANKYANPYNKDAVANKLDFVILGATEIDVNFNVNVTTTSTGALIGGSGGHSDTAHGANVTIITTNLIKSRMPIIKEQVLTVTTPGEDIDVLVTERGIAINPLRTDLLEKLKNSKLKIYKIEELLEIAHKITGVPQPTKHSDKVVGVVMYRDGSVIDSLYQKQ